MLTGIEITGLILAVFPLIISTLEHYEDGFQSIKDWKKFRAEFATFMNCLALQRLLFRQNVEDLLSSFVTSDHDMTSMLEDPNDPSWKSQALEEQLRSRLSGKNEYDCYMTQVIIVRTILEKLCERLKVDPGQPHWSQTTGKGLVRLEFEFRRFLYTISKRKRQKLMSELEKSNEALRTLLGNSDRLDPVRKKRSSALPKLFEQFRAQAASFHAAASKALRCRCSSVHSTNLVLLTTSREENFSKRISTSTEVKLDIYFPLKSSGWSGSRSHTTLNDSWCAIEIEMAGDTKRLSRSSLSVNAIPNPLKADAKALALEGRTISFLDDELRDKPANAPVSEQSLPEGVSEIEDLCMALKRFDQDSSYLGFLRDDDEKVHVLRNNPNGIVPPTQVQEVVKLDSLLDGTQGVTIPRRIRLSIALTMAKTLLQLHTSPWLKEDWSKSDIYFFQNQFGELKMYHPLLICEFDPRDSSRRSSQTLNLPLQNITSRGSRSAILSLGILVLELWFNQAIESIPLRKQFLGLDGCENEYTKFNTAQKWQEQALEEGGIDLDNVTRRCIYCAFGAASQNLSDEELRKAMYIEVVKGLERLLSRYEDY